MAYHIMAPSRVFIFHKGILFFFASLEHVLRGPKVAQQPLGFRRHDVMRVS